MFKVTINNETKEYNEKVTLDELASIYKPKALVAKVNNRLRELTYYVYFFIVYLPYYSTKVEISVFFFHWCIPSTNNSTWKFVK